MKLIGITQRIVSIDSRNEICDTLDKNWASLLSRNGLIAVPLPNCKDTILNLLKNVNFSGFILSGGNNHQETGSKNDVYPSRDDTEEHVLSYAKEKKLPLLGVCRGMQAMIIGSGIPLVRLANHVRTHHEIMVSKNERFPFSGKLIVNSYHEYGIYKKDLKGWEAVGECEDGSLEAMAHPSLPQIGIMWHPERGESSRYNDLLLRSLFKC